MAAKIFLGINAAIFILYGLVCLVAPSTVAEAAGLHIATGDGAAELRAMYGGVQIAMGMLALVAVLRPVLQRMVLLVFAFLFFGLASARMIGTLVDPGVGAYTFSALIFEVVWAVASVALLSRTARDAAEPHTPGAAAG